MRAVMALNGGTEAVILADCDAGILVDRPWRPLRGDAGPAGLRRPWRVILGRDRQAPPDDNGQRYHHEQEDRADDTKKDADQETALTLRSGQIGKETLRTDEVRVDDLLPLCLPATAPRHHSARVANA